MVKLELNYNQAQRTWMDSMIAACRVCGYSIYIKDIFYGRILSDMKKRGQTLLKVYYLSTLTYVLEYRKLMLRYVANKYMYVSAYQACILIAGHAFTLDFLYNCLP